LPEKQAAAATGTGPRLPSARPIGITSAPTFEGDPMTLTTSLRTALRVVTALALLIAVSWLVSKGFWLLSQPSDLQMALGFILLMVVFVAGIGAIERLISAPLRELMLDVKTAVQKRQAALRRRKKEVRHERGAETPWGGRADD
jgi:hypothetical protein